MIGYGMVKAAVFHLVSSLSSEGSGLPKGSKVVAILPIWRRKEMLVESVWSRFLLVKLWSFSVTIDTPMNRKAMPDADRSTWTPLDVIAGYVRH
ncbi:MAG: hypothetical protein BJ554DRAFT_279 [Olpidium bornovanus]|uniref:Uncharacterized protein n=1 Tax=Olpidium bornovanus TaxID=278681 RepID=A0A8H7ZTT3_9FUNG|nr:MAG: hypothetical protein BJ554DRAFT_279 [Olpidium bornovanus]